MANIINQHNFKTLSSQKDIQARSCNFRVKANCPLDGKCLSKCIVYKAKITANTSTYVYYGTFESEFKIRYNNHTKYFRTRKYEHDTQLSKFLWSLKDRGVNYNIKWFITAHATPYKCGTGKCNLCLTEKVCIIRADENRLLNKRNELIPKS